MKARPILFSSPMVLALLEGRKTQTRRLYRERECDNVEDPLGALFSLPSPYGSPGDLLWVREAITCTSLNKRPPPYDDDVATAAYEADGQTTALDRWPWKRWRLPGMFMPYGLRRITLEITEVRVQRLQEISEEAARAEGIPTTVGYDVPGAGLKWFSTIWDRINGTRCPWASNPFVWALTFRRVP